MLLIRFAEVVQGYRGKFSGDSPDLLKQKKLRGERQKIKAFPSLLCYFSVIKY